MDTEQDERISALESDVAALQADLVGSSVVALRSYTFSLVRDYASSVVCDLPYGTYYLLSYDPRYTTCNLYICTSLTRTYTTINSSNGSVTSEYFDLGGILYHYTFYLPSNPNTPNFSVGFADTSSSPSSSVIRIVRSGASSQQLIYCSLPNMPHLIEQEDSYEIQALFVLALGGCLFYFMSRIRNRLRL